MDNNSTGKCTSWIFPAALWTHEWKQWEEMAFSHKLISISSMADVHFTTLPPFKCPNQYTTSGPQMTTFRHNVRKPKQIFVNVMNMLLFKYSKKDVWLKHFNKKGRNWGISGNPHEEQLKLKAANSNWQSESNEWLILLYREGKRWYLSKEKWSIRYCQVFLSCCCGQTADKGQQSIAVSHLWVPTSVTLLISTMLAWLQ